MKKVDSRKRALIIKIIPMTAYKGCRLKIVGVIAEVGNTRYWDLFKYIQKYVAEVDLVQNSSKKRKGRTVISSRRCVIHRLRVERY